MNQEMEGKLRRQAAGFEAREFEAYLSAIEASYARRSRQPGASDEDDLFEWMLEDVLPDGADEELEGRVMLLLDAWLDLV